MDTSTPLEPKTFPNRIGYGHVSSIGQNLDSQMDFLKQAGCIKFFTDKLTGSPMERPGWEDLLNYIRPEEKRMEEPEPMSPNSRMRGSCIGILVRPPLRFVKSQV